MHLNFKNSQITEEDILYETERHRKNPTTFLLREETITSIRCNNCLHDEEGLS